MVTKQYRESRLPGLPAALAGWAIFAAATAQEQSPQERTVTARNEAVELSVPALRVSDRYGPIRAEPGTRFLVVATEWRNLVPTSVVDGKVLPTPYLVPDLEQQLFAIVGGGRVAPFAAACTGRPGTLPTKAFTVPDPQDPTRGNLVFAVPEAAADALIVFVDDRHGAFSLRILGEEKPLTVLAGPARNELVEALAAGQRVLTDQQSPAETEWIALDLRIKSVHTSSPKAKCASLFRWPEWQNYIQLLVDGTHAATAQRSPFDATATILPEVSTGGEFVFRVPKARTTLDLALYFAEMPGKSGRIRPRPILLRLAGGSTTPPAEPAIARWKDAFYALELTSKSVGANGDKPSTTLRFAVTNHGKTWEILQPYEQLALADASGKSIKASTEQALRLLLPAPEQLLIPPGQRRTFELAYAAGPEATRLVYASADPKGSKLLDLPGEAPASRPNPEIAKAGPEPDKPAAGAPPAQPAQPAQPAKNPDTKAPTEPGKAKEGPAQPRVPVHPDRKPSGIAGVGITPEQINAAIDRACVGLWDEMTQKSKRVIDFGSSGRHILGALALVHARYHERVPELDASIRKYLSRQEPLDDTYVAGITAMLIEAYGDAQYLPLLRANTEWLMNSALPDGTWSYNQPRTKNLPAFFTKLPPPPPATMLRAEGGVDFLADAGKLVTRNPAMPAHEGSGDNSVTQYALLGLDAAHRCGQPVPQSIWRSVVAVTLDRQCPDGGWCYTKGYSNGYGSMTAAGVCALALANHYLGQPSEGDVAIERGLAWLDANFDVTKNPLSAPNWHHYWLYSVERVGRLLDTEFIGTREWYPLGARQLLGSQLANGCWKTNNEDETLATAFALLFLTRATPSLAPTRPVGPGKLTTSVVQPMRRKLYIVLDASGSMLEEIRGKTKFELARTAVLDLVKTLPATTEVALRVYGHRKRAIEEGADEDSELVLSSATLDLPKFTAKLNALRPRGKTPLAHSLEQSLSQVTSGTPDNPLTLLLLTDGGEDTKARRDPVAVCKKLTAIKNLRFKIVGFDINRDIWKTQLLAMAEAGNGEYLAALDDQTLAEQLRAATLELPARFTVKDKAGRTVGSGAFGEGLTLEPGEYEFATRYGTTDLRTKVMIRSQGTTRIVFDPSLPPAQNPK